MATIATMGIIAFSLIFLPFYPIHNHAQFVSRWSYISQAPTIGTKDRCCDNGESAGIELLDFLSVYHYERFSTPISYTSDPFTVRTESKLVNAIVYFSLFSIHG